MNLLDINLEEFSLNELLDILNEMDLYLKYIDDSIKEASQNDKQC